MRRDAARSSASLAGRSAPGRPLLLFDGPCLLCERSVRWLLAHDRRGRLLFAPLQGSLAASLRARHALPDELDSVVLVLELGGANESIRLNSDAVLGALAELGGWRSWLRWLRLVPRPLRDAAYRFVARRRTRWFGRREGCRLPGPDERQRFLE